MTLEKWSQYPIDLHIFMIANELNRLKNNIEASLGSDILRETLERTFELLDLTICSQGGTFRKELLRFREIFGEFYLMTDLELNSSAPEVKKFFRVNFCQVSEPDSALPKPSPTPPNTSSVT